MWPLACALVMKSRKNLPQGCVPFNYTILLFAYFAVLPFVLLRYILHLVWIYRIVTLITLLPVGKTQLMEYMAPLKG